MFTQWAKINRGYSFEVGAHLKFSHLGGASIQMAIISNLEDYFKSQNII